MTTVVISGANRGIGLELARQYAAAGAKVIAGVRNPEGASELKALDAVQVHRLDVAEDASVQAFRAALGDRPIDILIANAGVYGHRAQQLGALDFDDWLKTLNINSLGPMRLAQALIAHVKAGLDKKLVAITSTLGSTSTHGGDMFVYRSSMAALNNAWAGLGKALAADGIVCLPLHPGWVQTDMGGKGAMLTVKQSVDGLRKVIAEAGPAQSGRAFTYDGKPLDW